MPSRVRLATGRAAGDDKGRYRFVYVQIAIEGGSCFLDDAALDQVSGPVPPVIRSLFPLNMIFVNPAMASASMSASPSGFTINNSAIAWW